MKAFPATSSWLFVIVGGLLLWSILGCVEDRPTAQATPPEVSPPVPTDRELVLAQLIQDILTNPEFETFRRDILGPGAPRYCLVKYEDYGEPWPTQFLPTIDGWVHCGIPNLDPEEKDNIPPLLGIRLDSCDLNQEHIDPFHGNIRVVIYNAGGFAGLEEFNDLSASLAIYYEAKMIGNRWDVHGLMAEH